MADLKPCPHCGGPGRSLARLFKSDNGRCFVQSGCGQCGALGPAVELDGAVYGALEIIGSSTPAADAAWNCRKDIPFPSDLECLG